VTSALCGVRYKLFHSIAGTAPRASARSPASLRADLPSRTIRLPLPAACGSPSNRLMCAQRQHQGPVSWDGHPTERQQPSGALQLPQTASASRLHGSQSPDQSRMVDSRNVARGSAQALGSQTRVTSRYWILQWCHRLSQRPLYRLSAPSNIGGDPPRHRRRLISYRQRRALVQFTRW
jgi:hypothetical protein